MLEDSIQNLCRLGYRPDEASFLRMAGIHSGYFVRRQFEQFIGASGGGASARFIEQIVDRGHARIIHFRPDRLIYHICALRIYARFDDADNRNRREKAPSTIKRKLMCLDFVLANRAQQFLESENRKVSYFADAWGIRQEHLPFRRYKFRRSTGERFSYFVDKLPIYVSPQPTDEDPAVHFAYIDDGLQTLAAFHTFLIHHHPLFMALKSFEVIFVAADGSFLESARRVFRRCYREDGTTTLGELDAEQIRMIEFFRMRRKREDKDFRGLGTEGLAVYRTEKEHFAGSQYEELYRKWMVEGESALCRHILSPNPLEARFRTVVLPHDYEIFGSLSHAS